MILKWDKPGRAMKDGQLAWKATMVGKQVEIRKTTSNGTQMLLIVSLDGFRHKEDRRHPDGKEFPGKNVRISLNGPAAFTFEEIEQMTLAIKEAKQMLRPEKEILSGRPVEPNPSGGFGVIVDYFARMEKK